MGCGGSREGGGTSKALPLESAALAFFVFTLLALSLSFPVYLSELCFLSLLHPVLLFILHALAQKLSAMNAAARAARSSACSTSTSSPRTTMTKAAARSLASSSTSSPSRRRRFSPFLRSDSHLTRKLTSLSSIRTALRAIPELADALNLASSSASLDAISIASSSTSTAAAAAAAATEAATSLAASIARYASAAMLTLAELTNEATTAVTAEETRVVASLAEVVGTVSPSTSTSSSSLHHFLLASLPASSIFYPPNPEPANALSLPTWAIHVSSVAEWVVAMNLFWRLGDSTDVPQWKGMSWGMTPLLGGALCACTFHFFYNSPTLAPLVALQAGLTVVGNATMWFAAWRVFEATRGRREADDREEKRKREEEGKQQA